MWVRGDWLLANVHGGGKSVMPSEITLKQWIKSGKEQVVISEAIKWFQCQRSSGR